MPAEDIAAWIGAPSGIIALVGWAITVGTYKAKIDRHTQILDMIVGEAMQQMFAKKRVGHSSPLSIADPNLIPANIRGKLDGVRPCTKGSITERAVAATKSLEPGDLAEIAQINSCSLPEAVILCVAYVEGRGQ